MVSRDGIYRKYNVSRTDGRDGRLEDFAIAYTFGVDPLQQYLIELPDGRVVEGRLDARGMALVQCVDGGHRPLGGLRPRCDDHEGEHARAHPHPHLALAVQPAGEMGIAQRALELELLAERASAEPDPRETPGHR